MLTSKQVHYKGPAATSRRPLLSSLLFAAVAVACSGTPPPDYDPVRRAAGKATRLVRVPHPHRAAYIDRLLLVAEKATAVEAASPAWRRDPGRVESAWLRVAIASREVTREVWGRNEGDKARYRQLHQAVRNEVARAEQEVAETGMGARAGAAIARARTSLTTAERLAGGGEHARANDVLLKARDAAGIVHSSWAALHHRLRDPRLVRQWQRWVSLALEESKDEGTPAIIVDKLNRRLDVFVAGRRISSYAAELGANGLRRKEHAGDRATPEGVYQVTQKKNGRQTRYYKALLINYPNEDDRARYDAGRQRGTIPRRAGIGNLIEIHGDGGEGRDWTDGCVALRNEHMDEVFSRVRVGTPVIIVGTYER